MSYKTTDQATDEVINRKIKKKLGNASYTLARRDSRLSQSPRTPTSTKAAE